MCRTTTAITERLAGHSSILVPLTVVIGTSTFDHLQSDPRDAGTSGGHGTEEGLVLRCTITVPARSRTRRRCCAAWPLWPRLTAATTLRTSSGQWPTTPRRTHERARQRARPRLPARLHERAADSGAGVAAQRAAIMAETTRRGWKVEFTEDAGYSARSMKRPGLLDALDQLRRGEADTSW